MWPTVKVPHLIHTTNLLLGSKIDLKKCKECPTPVSTAFKTQPFPLVNQPVYI